MMGAGLEGAVPARLGAAGAVKRMGQLQCVRDRLERQVQIGGDQLDSNDDGNSDQGSNQTVFNGSHTGFVFDEFFDGVHDGFLQGYVDIDK
jgi:hypothetical protein